MMPVVVDCSGRMRGDFQAHNLKVRGSNPLDDFMLIHLTIDELLFRCVDAEGAKPSLLAVERIGGAKIGNLIPDLCDGAISIPSTRRFQQIGDHLADFHILASREPTRCSSWRAEAKACPLRWSGRAKWNRILVRGHIRSTKNILRLLPQETFRRYIDQNQMRVGISTNDPHTTASQ